MPGRAALTSWLESATPFCLAAVVHSLMIASGLWPGAAGTRTPAFRSVVPCAGIRTRSDQYVTSGSSLPVVQLGPEHSKVVHPCGSQRGSQPHALWALLVVFKSIRGS